MHTTPRAPLQPGPRRGGVARLLAWLSLLPVAAAAQQAVAPSADELRRDLYTLENRVSLGAGLVGGTGRRFGQYSGLTESRTYGLLDVDLLRRDDATGTWLKLKGVRLGQDTRALRFTHERQGDWAYTLQVQQWARHEPLVVTTALQGVGTAGQVISANAPKRELNLEVKHDITGLGVRKFVVQGLDVQLSLRRDEAKGDRLMGRGTTNVMEFLTEPVDRVTRQWHAQVGYAGPGLQWVGGYSGSLYENRNPVLRSTGGNAAANVFSPLWAIALPPSNAAYQVFLSGGTTPWDAARVSIKLSRSVATQNQGFDPVFARLAGAPDSLNGRVVTTLVYADLSQRWQQRFDASLSLRVEDRDDQTPQARFLAETLPSVGGSFSTAGFTGLYKPRSLKQGKATADLGAVLPDGWRLSASVEQEDLHRNVSLQYRRVGMRERTGETTARFDIKRSGGEQLNGGLAMLRSRRGGSDYVGDTYDPNALTNQVNALLWADRQRDKLRATLDWLPDEAVSLQLQADLSRDSYSGRAMGPRKGEAQFLSADLLWRMDDAWSLTAWASHERNQARQTQRSDRVGAAAAGYDTVWDAELRYATRVMGLGLRGKPSGTLQLGADLSASQDMADTDMRQTGGTGTSVLPVLPPSFYRQHALKLFADWQVQRQAGVRLELGLDRRRNNDWTWTNWVYNGSPAVTAASRSSDGTTVTNLPAEHVAWVGVRYHVRWR